MLQADHILVPAAIERLHQAVARGDAMAILRATRQMQALVAGLAPGAVAVAECLAAARAAEAACAATMPGKAPSRAGALRAKAIYGNAFAGARVDG